MMAQDSALITVIVTIFQAEPYLRRCVDSILSQTYKNIEVLLINDGSTDGSGVICDDYAKKDDRVRVVHKENEGVSAACQVGIDHALGEYAIFCDQDDWMEPSMIEVLTEKAKVDNVDIVMCDFAYECKDRSYVIPQKIKTNTAEELLNKIHYPIISCTWNKLIRRSCYIDYNVRFPRFIEYAEDLYVMVELLQHPLKIAYVPKVLYHYDRYSNMNSITNSISTESYMRAIDYFDAHLGAKAKVVIDKMKCDVLVMLYKDLKYNENYNHIYREADRALLGFDWHCLSFQYRKWIIYFYRNHKRRLGEAMSALFYVLKRLKAVVPL